MQSEAYMGVSSQFVVALVMVPCSAYVLRYKIQVAGQGDSAVRRAAWVLAFSIFIVAVSLLPASALLIQSRYIDTGWDWTDAAGWGLSIGIIGVALSVASLQRRHQRMIEARADADSRRVAGQSATGSGLLRTSAGAVEIENNGAQAKKKRQARLFRTVSVAVIAVVMSCLFLGYPFMKLAEHGTMGALWATLWYFVLVAYIFSILRNEIAPSCLCWPRQVDWVSFLIGCCFGPLVAFYIGQSA